MNLTIMADMVGWDVKKGTQDLVIRIKAQDLLSEEGMAVAEVDHVGSAITSVRVKVGENTVTDGLGANLDAKV
jgi:hypothetical protein